MNWKRLAIGALGAAAALATPAAAHHSFARFDSNRMYVWEGTVVEYRWMNPHSRVVVSVPGTAKDKKTVGKWDLEGGSPNIMSRQGWSKASFKPGDKIVVVGQPARDNTKAGSIYYAIKNGKRIYHDVNRKGGPAGGGKIPPGVVLP